MSVISLEMAKKLKDAGLKWEPQEGDWFYYASMLDFIKDNEEAKGIKGVYSYPHASFTYCPHLDQLLTEIEKYYEWSLYKDADGYKCDLFIDQGVYFTSDEQESADDAAAEALLWILEQEAQA